MIYQVSPVELQEEPVSGLILFGRGEQSAGNPPASQSEETEGSLSSNSLETRIYSAFKYFSSIGLLLNQHGAREAYLPVGKNLAQDEELYHI